MTPELEALARRAVACKGWRWMPGMAAVDRHGVRGRILIIEDRQYKTANRAGASWITERQIERCLLDLSDPCSLGGLLALIREAWETHRGSDCIASTFHTGTGWGVGSRCASGALAVIVLPTYETEAEALVAALEAAP